VFVRKLQEFLGGRTGELYIESQSSETIIIANSFPLCDEHFRSSGHNDSDTKANGSSREWFPFKM
jgi:hypothetical protein